MCSLDRGGNLLQQHDVPMIPFYIYYSMFGFQRVGDLDLGGRRHARARLPARRHRRPHHAERRRPAARGRPQPPVSSTIPNCISYDPTFAYELAVIIQDGLRRMYRRAGGRVLLHHGDERELRAPGDAGGCEEGILKGMYLLRETADGARARACSCWAAARSCAKSSPPRTCWRTTSASPPTSGVARASPSSPRGA